MKCNNLKVLLPVLNNLYSTSMWLTMFATPLKGILIHGMSIIQSSRYFLMQYTVSNVTKTLVSMCKNNNYNYIGTWYVYISSIKVLS